MRPNQQEVLTGAMRALGTYILPELQTEHARLELMLINVLLGTVAVELDGAAQGLVDDNAALRALARRGADALAASNGSADESEGLAEELRALAGGTDDALRLSDLTAANDALHAAVGRLAALVEAGDAPALRELRAPLIECLRAEAESRALPVLGPRVDG
jgi:hypothetical protein